jgi:hypothetical protein
MNSKYEFFGAFICWMFTGFRGKLENHYSNGSGSRQLINFFIGFIGVILIGISLAVIKSKISDS